MKDKKGIVITNAFQKVLKESNGKQNKICVEKGSEFYNRSMKSGLEKKSIEMYSRNKKGGLLLLKDLLEPSKIKFINTWLQFQKIFYIDKLYDIVVNIIINIITQLKWNLLI